MYRTLVHILQRLTNKMIIPHKLIATMHLYLELHHMRTIRNFINRVILVFFLTSKSTVRMSIAKLDMWSHWHTVNVEFQVTVVQPSVDHSPDAWSVLKITYYGLFHKNVLYNIECIPPWDIENDFVIIINLQLLDSRQIERNNVHTERNSWLYLSTHSGI